MSSGTLNSTEIQDAEQTWERYQQTHDLSDQNGRTAGIDPATGEVCIGDSIAEIVKERKQSGLNTPLVFKRIGSATYYRKGGRR